MRSKENPCVVDYMALNQFELYYLMTKYVFRVASFVGFGRLKKSKQWKHSISKFLIRIFWKQIILNEGCFYNSDFKWIVFWCLNRFFTWVINKSFKFLICFYQKLTKVFKIRMYGLKKIYVSFWRKSNNKVHTGT